MLFVEIMFKDLMMKHKMKNQIELNQAMIVQILHIMKQNKTY